MIWERERGGGLRRPEAQCTPMHHQYEYSMYNTIPTLYTTTSTTDETHGACIEKRPHCRRPSASRPNPPFSQGR